MTVKRMLALCAALVILCLTIGMMPDEVYAQNNSGAAASRNKGDDEDNLNPSKAQMAVGIGSFIVMIIVVKWL